MLAFVLFFTDWVLVGVDLGFVGVNENRCYSVYMGANTAASVSRQRLVLYDFRMPF